MNIGRRIYYEKASGNVIMDTGERNGDVLATTIDQDFVSYSALSGRERSSVGFVEFEYGAYSKEFEECDGYRISPESGAIAFF